MKEKLIIYQVFPRIFTNMNSTCKPWGTYTENGSGKFNDFDDKLIKSIGKLGANCIWMTGVIEMATKTKFKDIPADNPNVVKGEAGSPYAIKDYYDVAPSLALNVESRMEEFEAMITRVHSNGMKIIIDFVPNHTARRYHSDQVAGDGKDFGAADDSTKFFRRDNNYYYLPNQQFQPHFSLDREGDTPYREFPSKATGNDCFTAFCSENDWYETVKLNYGYDPGDGSRHFYPVPDTWNKMLEILRFWCSKGVDGFRCDMVFMVPSEFWNWVIPQVKQDYPDVIFIGEIYDVNLYRPFIEYCHFDYLYDKVNLYDTLVGIERHGFSAAQLTYCWQRIDGLGNRMLNFLENHDEVRYASKEYANDPMKVIPSLVVSSMISKGPFMIYYGQEMGINGHDNEGFAGDNNRTTIFDYWSYDVIRRWYNHGKCSSVKLTAQEKWLRGVYTRVLTLCNKCEAIREGDFFDIMYVNLNNPGFDPHRQFAFIRYSEKEAYLFIANFNKDNTKISINIPKHAIEMCGLQEGVQTGKDLLWGDTYRYEVGPDCKVELQIGGYNALILPLKKLKNKGEIKK